MWLSIASVVGGFLATAVLVGATTAIASRLLVGPPGPQPPATVGAAYLAVNLILGLASAAVGGLICAWVAPHSRAVHVGVLAGLLGILSFVTALTSSPQPGQPRWYPWAIGVIGVVGILAGGVGWLCLGGDRAEQAAAPGSDRVASSSVPNPSQSPRQAS
jgi:hypothetical protein